MIQFLTCKKCLIEKEKSSTYFYKSKSKIGFDSTCKCCRKIRDKELDHLHPNRKKDAENKRKNVDERKLYISEYRKKYYLENKEKSNAATKKYYLENTDSVKETVKKYYLENKNKILNYNKEYQNKESSKKKRSQYLKNRKKENINVKLKHNIRNQFLKFFKGLNKTSNIQKYLNCSIEDFKRYIENKFYDNMSWDNYGRDWQLDHIIPCELFDHTDLSELKICWNYQNYQPLTKEDNNSKKDKLPCGNSARTFNSYKEYIKHIKDNKIDLNLIGYFVGFMIIDDLNFECIITNDTIPTNKNK